MIIGIDFDGTVVTHEYPNVGHDIGAIPVLKQLAENGHKFVLFTMRSSKNGTLQAAVKWFNENGIPLYGVNRNPQQDWTDSPKAYCHLYIDDAAFGCPRRFDKMSGRYCVDWKKMEEMLREEGLLQDMELYESKKKVVKNDEGKIVPEKCDKCGGDVVLQIHGEPVYLCKKCGKYFGTMPFKLKESKIMKKNIVKINERQLRKIMSESICEILSNIGEKYLVYWTNNGSYDNIEPIYVLKTDDIDEEQGEVMINGNPEFVISENTNFYADNGSDFPQEGDLVFNVNNEIAFYRKGLGAPTGCVNNDCLIGTKQEIEQYLSKYSE